MTVAASLNIDPALFRVAILDVPFVDCLATMLDESIPLTVIEYDEWGQPNASVDMFEYMCVPEHLQCKGLSHTVG